MHLYLSGEIGDKRLDKTHFFTGCIPLEDVVRLLVDEYGVQIRKRSARGNDRGRAVLATSRARFVQERGWA